MVSTGRHVAIVGSYAESLINFRGPLIAALIASGVRVTALAPGANEGETGVALRRLGASPLDSTLIRTGVNPASDLSYYRELKMQFEELKPDAVLSYTAKPVIWGTLAAHRANVPHVVAMITGLGYAFIPPRRVGLKYTITSTLARMLYRISLGKADRILFQNPEDRDLFVSRRLLQDRGQIRLVDGSGVDLEHYRPAPLPVAPNFLMIGRLLGAKGVREYAAAALALKARHPHARFQLVGWRDEGPDTVGEAELQSWIAGGVEHLGRLDDVRPAIASARIYVLPSYREGTPRSVLEAMAMGRPIITTDAPGCRETVVNGVNGLLVPPRDPIALEAAMEHLILHPDQAAAMGRASLQRVRARYDVHRVNAQILSALSL